MHCREVMVLLERAAEEGLDLHEVKVLHDHLDICDGCQEAYDRLLAFHEILEGEPLSPPPPGFHAKVMETIQGEVRRGEGFFPPFVQLLFAALSLVAVTAVAAGAGAGELGAYLSGVHLLYATRLRDLMDGATGHLDTLSGGVGPAIVLGTLAVFVLLNALLGLRAAMIDSGETADGR